MVEQTENLLPNACPHPEGCPHGAKPAGYHCAVAFALRTPTGDVLKCSYCELQKLGYMGVIQASQQPLGGIVLAGPGALGGGPGNNGRRDR